MVGTISGNTITNNDSLSGPGISALATGTGQMVVKISGNNVSHVDNLGISAIASQGSSHLDATVINNTVTLTGADAAQAGSPWSPAPPCPPTPTRSAPSITGNNSSTTGASYSSGSASATARPGRPSRSRATADRRPTTQQWPSFLGRREYGIDLGIARHLGRLRWGRRMPDPMTTSPRPARPARSHE